MIQSAVGFRIAAVPVRPRRGGIARSITCVALACALALVGTASAQDETTEPESDPTRPLIEALALYPEDLRTVVLEASTMPGVLEGLAGIQARSSADFRALLAELPQEQQGAIWDLMRFPGLVGELVQGGPKTEDELKRLVAGRPEPIRKTAVQYGQSHYALLEKIRALEAEVDASVAKLLAPYPLSTQATFHSLVDRPDVLSALVEKPELTREVGAIYTADPDGTRKRLERYAEEVARRNSEAIDEWERELAADPDALAELEDSADEFAKEEGIDTTAPAPEQASTSETKVTVEYYGYAYPYWFGYPYWFAYSYWYPLPYYYDWGFYYGSGGRVVVLSTGSYRFLSWHYRHPHHHIRYPHLHALYLDYARRHDRYHGGGSEAVRDWARGSLDRLPRDWARRDGRLPERFAEYGRFEESYAKANRKRPQSREDFMRSHPERFESLRTEGASRRRDGEGERETRRDEPARKQRASDRSRESRRSGTQPVTRGRGGESQQRQEGWENHSGSWRRSSGGASSQRRSGSGSRSSGKRGGSRRGGGRR